MTSGERAFVWAKACGILGKSTLGRRRDLLRSVDRPSDLYRLLVPDRSPEGTERDISRAAQRAAQERSLASIKSILKSYASAPPVLVRLFRAYEYADLKQAVAAVAAGERHAPVFTDLGGWGTVRFAAYPDLAAMVAGTEFSWLPEGVGEKDLPSVMAKFDKTYYRKLWTELDAAPSSDIAGLRDLIAEEVSLKNVVWTLRMRTYYHSDRDALEAILIDLPGSKIPTLSWARQAEEFPLDRRDAWAGWRLERLLNPERPGAFWALDPRWVQNAAARCLAFKARKVFRRNPFALDAPAAFIKLVQYEEDLLSATAEGLVIGLRAVDVMKVLEAAPC